MHMQPNTCTNEAFSSTSTRFNPYFGWYKHISNNTSQSNLDTAHAINLGMTEERHINLDVGIARASARKRLIQSKAA